MKSREQGIALIASLIVLAVLVAVGTSSMFLARMNLGIAENTRSAAIATNNANSGLDAVLVYLADAYEKSEEDPATFPATLVGFVPPTGYDFEVLDYTRVSADRATVEVRGTVPGRNASHRSEALVSAAESRTKIPPGVNPLFGQGLVTEGTIKFPGNAQVDINMWAGGDVTVTGRGQTTVSADSAFLAGGSCQVGSLTCTGNGTAPTVPTPDFDELRGSVVRCAFGTLPADTECADVEDSYWAENPVTDLCEGVTTFVRYDSPAGGVNDPPVVCLPPNASYTVSEDDITVIGDRTTTVTVSGDVDGVTIASGAVDLTSESTMTGYSTIFAQDAIELRKGFSALEDGTVGAFIASEGDVTVRGNGGRSVYAVIWTGGSYIINGASQEMITNVLAKSTDLTGSIRSNGNNGLVQQAERLDNPFLPGDPGGVTIAFGGFFVDSVRR